MKFIIIALCLLIAPLGFCDATGSITVTTNSTIIIPMADVSGLSLASWSSNSIYAQGDYVKNSLLRSYWTSNGGTSTNMPSHLQGGYTYADGLTWYYIDGTTRRQAVLTNTGTNTVWISFGNTDAVLSEGFPLDEDERYFYSGQKAVSGISSASATVKTIEEDL